MHQTKGSPNNTLRPLSSACGFFVLFSFVKAISCYNLCLLTLRPHFEPSITSPVVVLTLTSPASPFSIDSKFKSCLHPNPLEHRLNEGAGWQQETLPGQLVTALGTLGPVE